LHTPKKKTRGSYNNLISICVYSKKFEEANILLNKQSLWNINRMLSLPINDNLKIHLLISMAGYHELFDDYSNALKEVLQAWDIYEKNFPENKSIRLSILNQMSYIYSQYTEIYRTMKKAFWGSKSFGLINTNFRRKRHNNIRIPTYISLTLLVH